MKMIHHNHLSEKTVRIIGMVLALLAVLLVFSVEQILKPAYWIKSALKVTAFLGTMIIYTIMRGKPFTETVRLKKIKNVKPLITCMVLFFVGVAGLFFLLRNQLDMSSIKQSLIDKENLTKENCLFVFAYIILCNSFLEESFFRGFVFQLFADRRVGAVVSAVLFSLYHIGIFATWFNPFVFVLCVIGLAIVGLFLQWLAEKYKSIVAGYVTHACANTAINIIGALLIFGIIH